MIILNVEKINRNSMQHISDFKKVIKSVSFPAVQLILLGISLHDPLLRCYHAGLQLNASNFFRQKQINEVEFSDRQVTT